MAKEKTGVGSKRQEHHSGNGWPLTPQFNGGAMETLFAIQQHNIEAVREIGDLMMSASQAMMTQQVAALKSMTDQWTNGNGKLLNSRAPEVWGTALADYMRSWTSASFALAQATAETGSRCCMDAGALVAKRCADATAECKTLAQTDPRQS